MVSAALLSRRALLAAPWVGRPKFTVVRESPDAQKTQVYSPGLARLDSGRLVATCDLTYPPDTNPKAVKIEAGKLWTNEIYTSDNRGKSWTRRAEHSMMHARPFAAGNAVYVLGHQFDLTITRSADGGETWSAPVRLTQGQSWHQAPCNVHYANGRVYLVMERITDMAFRGWPVSVLAPVVMSAPVTTDLTRRDSWVFSNELVFRDAVAQAGAPHLLGVPFFSTGNTDPRRGGRGMAPIGWLETNVVQFTNPDHMWFDPAGRTYHLWMRAHTGGTNLACIAKAVESAGRTSIEVKLETAPSGEPVLYVPCPGGHLKFHILWDQGSRMFWLLSSQSTDSMTRPERLPEDRYGLPNNERHRLALHYSTNCIDWQFAGLVAAGPSPRQARHYASMIIDGRDLFVLSRSGDQRAKSAHDGNLITFHTVPDFRRLIR